MVTRLGLELGIRHSRTVPPETSLDEVVVRVARNLTQVI